MFIFPNFSQHAHTKWGFLANPEYIFKTTVLELQANLVYIFRTHVPY